MIKNTSRDLNEFRQDLVSGDWVLFATARIKRPHATEKVLIKEESVAETCPFDDPRATGQEILSEYKKSNGELWVTVIKNKYPAVVPNACVPVETICPFRWTAANGFHEVLVTSDHKRIFPDFTLEETVVILKPSNCAIAKISTSKAQRKIVCFLKITSAAF